MKKLICVLMVGGVLLFQTMFLFAATLGADLAPEQPLVRAFGDGKYWVLNEDLVWVIGKTNETIVVKKGFVTDYASIPKAVGDLVGLKRNGQYDRAAIIHDYLYWAQGCTKKQADRLLVIAMKESAVGSWDGFKIFVGVDKGGKPAWNSNAKEKAEGKPKFIPEKYLRPTDPNAKWPEYRKYLIEQSVKDPVFPQNPSYCKYGDSTEVPTQTID